MIFWIKKAKSTSSSKISSKVSIFRLYRGHLQSDYKTLKKKTTILTDFVVFKRNWFQLTD
jgi:hypothetical protein